MDQSETGERFGRGDPHGILAPVLSAFSLSKRYTRGVWALQDVTLAIPPGGITALVGPNAAGKSTLIKVWMGFERPSSGSVLVGDADPWTERSRSIPNLGYIAQTPGLYRDLTVQEHLDFACYLHPGFDRSFARGRLVELGIPVDARASELSGGQIAQVALAIALGTRAPTLLLDEPLASLDPLARQEFLSVLRSAVLAEGLTALLSSHIIGDIEAACDRILVLGGGRLLLEGRVSDVLASHRLVSVTPAGSEDDIVGSVSDLEGRRSLLVRRRSDDVPSAAATLEQVVMGYLQASRAKGPR